ncbi:yippee-domain-containing protein [Aulographum hederae CBS 113979]|uniref:Yippee-domain-containing protein n=1 Tax=Aulographum hederae CBS 113979 TaxID=1176131 RepID=A0A6G1GS15_9PEZI|nr:yippee-domain-containing protein [Aulographum hederae CBS 113979]
MHVPSPPLFPTYLLPSLPFRRQRQRRRSSESSTSTSSSLSTSSDASTSTALTSPSPPSTSPSPAARKQTYLSGHTSYLRCSRCLADLCPTSCIISKGFTGRYGRAYLVSPPPNPPPSSSRTSPQIEKEKEERKGNLPNTHVHKAVSRQLVTGAHTVADITCASCGRDLGWKYVAAEEEAQRYKVGKFILETRRVVRGVFWEGHGLSSEDGDEKVNEERETEFDSDDEDECEDLFAGVWDKEVARKRRVGRFGKRR